MLEVGIIVAGLSGALLMKAVFILPVEMKAVIIKLSRGRKLSSLRLCYKASLSEVGSCPSFNQSYQFQVLARHLQGSLSITSPGQLNLFYRERKNIQIPDWSQAHTWEDLTKTLAMIVIFVMMIRPAAAPTITRAVHPWRALC